MNIVTEIRDYIKTTYRKINPRAKEVNFPHSPDQVGTFDFNNTFYTRFLNVPVSKSSGYNVLIIPVEVEFSAKAGSDSIQEHDKIMCEAIQFASKLVKESNYNNNNISNITVTSINPESVLGNELWTKITVSANFEVFNNYLGE